MLDFANGQEPRRSHRMQSTRLEEVQSNLYLTCKDCLGPWIVVNEEVKGQVVQLWMQERVPRLPNIHEHWINFGSCLFGLWKELSICA